MHTLPELGYDYDSLEPYIDEETMKIHHDKHHQAYVDKLNAALENHKDLGEKPIEELIKDLGSLPEEIKTAVRNNGGGHLNHSFFWPLLKKDVEVSGEILEAIKATFGNFEGFKDGFSKVALGIFGSGWGWLVVRDGKLEIMMTPNQDSPLTQGKIPILCIDMWEHSMYLKFQNRKQEYLEAFFNVINWKKVNERFLKAKQ